MMQTARVNSSTRHLTLRHARRNAALSDIRSLAVNANNDEQTDKDLPRLDPGEEKLSSFYAPGLKAGSKQTITIKQIVKSEETKPGLELLATKGFYVDAPQFSLPHGSVHSVYPPPGYSESHRILPHVVLSDPHLPWERIGDHRNGANTSDRNRTPWLAVLAFTQDELCLSSDKLDGPSRMFPDSSDQKKFVQTPTFAVNMTISDLWKTKDVVTPITTDLGLVDQISKVRADMIFVGKELFTNLMSPFDEKNERKAVPSPQTSLYQYLAHVRNINTEGMAMAGAAEGNGHFAIVFGNRAGPLDNTIPTSVTVHLVSVEGVSDMKFPIDKPYVALCSLYSWTYTCQPQGMFEVYDTFMSLGETIDVLRPPSRVLDTLKPQDPVQLMLKQRLEDGYSLIQYRTQTGETSVALQRGPFTPTVVPPLSFSKCSNSGIDLQILDREVGIMDITYSAAWQLGRTLAIADQVFTGALVRFRSAIHVKAMNATKKKILEDLKALQTREVVLSNLSTTVKHLEAIHGNNATTDGGDDSTPFVPGDIRKRWRRPKLRKGEIADLSFSGKEMSDQYLENAIATALELSMAVSKDPDEIYDETNTPVSTDWMVVLGWLMDRLSLGGVPAHYYITDPSHLEHEKIRFFYIDENWTDALIDGALSLANHMGNDKDRVAIKEALNRYIKTVPRKQQHAPQIPKYGFLLRSDLVTRFPDLKVTTKPDADPRAPLLRHEIIADGVMLCLFDRVPGSELLQELHFTQPPHQQCFTVAQSLDLNHFRIRYRRLYTVTEAKRDEIEGPDKHTEALLDPPDIDYLPTSNDNLFIWGSKPTSSGDLRILRFPYYADTLLKKLQDNMNTKPEKVFDDDTTTSALVALQLNDPIFRLKIGLKENSKMVVAVESLQPETSGVDPFEPRLLKSMIPSTVTRLFPDEENPEEENLTPSTTEPILRSATGTFEQPPVEILRAPHLPAITTAAFSSTANRTEEPPAGDPQFSCRAYSQGSSSNQVLIGDALPQDIIFSIRVLGAQDSTYLLKDFAIKIPLGPVPKETDPVKVNYLMESYDGPGPTMLSNLRFNSLMQIDRRGDINYLVVRLVPRSTTNSIKISTVEDMSFRLSLALINEFEEGLVIIELNSCCPKVVRDAMCILLAMSKHRSNLTALSRMTKFESGPTGLYFSWYILHFAMRPGSGSSAQFCQLCFADFKLKCEWYR
ncbi:hypothetical protein BDD12DRAFT_918619 [Trichophaea hybrida]|nr:hypothetical protein BDD12DRAFT_918619 [Trichophaea hybrida]